MTTSERDAAIAALRRVYFTFKRMFMENETDEDWMYSAAMVVWDEIMAVRQQQGDQQVKTIDEHKINPVNDQIEIRAVDEPEFGAHHAYHFRGGHGPGPGTTLYFQKGPIDEHGINGITNEALLAVVLDRLRDFQSGPFVCKENACAITHLEEAMHWLHARTRERVARGVEGTYEV